MKKDFGLWIDHRKAVIVNLAHDSVKTITSEIADVFPPSGSHGITGIDAKDYPSEDHHDRHIEKYLTLFYAKVAKELSEPDRLFVMGPGEAKLEFAKNTPKLAATIDTFESTDKLSDRQILALVRQHFAQAD